MASRTGNKMENLAAETRKPFQVLQDLVSPVSGARANSPLPCPSNSARHWGWNGTGIENDKSSETTHVDYTVAATTVNTPVRDQPRPSALPHLKTSYSERRPGAKMTHDVALSYMKNSFSLTSLQINGGGAPVTPETPDAPRLYNSLTRPRDSARKTPFRRSWGSAAKEEAKDKEEFWSALQASYTYLMGTELIDSCKDANGEMCWDDGDLALPSSAKSPANLVATFEELMAWVCEVEEALELTPFSGTLRLRVREEMKQRVTAFAHWRQECQRWGDECPEARNHVELMSVNLSDKWDKVEALLLASLEEDEQLEHLDLTPQIHQLREWVREMESSLPQLSFRTGWTWEDLQQRIWAHNEFKREVERGGAEIRSLLRLCSQGGADKRAAAAVEQRWQQLLLRVYEWSLYLEQLAKRHANGWGARGGGVESDEEPLTKYCRVGDQEIVSEAHLDHQPDVPESGGQVMVGIHEDARRESGLLFSHSHKLDNSVSVTGDVGYSSDSGSDRGNLGPKSDLDLHQLNNNGQDNQTSVCTAQGQNPVLVLPVKTQSNIAVISYTHPDEDGQLSPQNLKKPKGGNLNSQAILHKKSANPRQNALVAVKKAATSTEEDEDEEEEWTFARNHHARRLDFDEDEENSEEQQSRYFSRSTSSDSDFLNAKSLELSDSEPSSLTVRMEVEPMAMESPVTCEKSMQASKESIYKLVEEAEHLIRPQSLILTEQNSAKSQRVVEWLHKKASPTDCDGHSCDASSELTSNDEESESEAQIEKRKSVVTKSPELAATPTVESLGFSVAPSTLPKVAMRGSRKRGERPWSLAGMPASLALTVQGSSLPSSQSETALHALAAPVPLRTQWAGQLASSPCLDPAYHSSASSGGRRRRTPRRRTKTRVSSGSSSSRVNLMSNSRKSLAEDCDETFVPVSPTREVGAASHVDQNASMEQETTEVSSKKSNDSPRSEFLEDMSSYSEQAWDNYQEHYLSEPYSEEAVDPSRLLAFGDDYRSHMDSLSDNFSVIGGRNNSKPPTPQHQHFTRRSPYRKPRPQPTAFFPADFDSDSDVEEFQHVVRTSLTQLGVASDTFERLQTAPRVEVAEWAELLALCRTHVECLMALSDAAGGEWEAVRDLLPSWTMLSSRVEKGHAQVTKCRDLGRAVQDSRSRLQELQLKVSIPQDSEASLEDQLEDIDDLKQMLREEHSDILSLNVSVHDFLTHVRETSQVGISSDNAQNNRDIIASPLVLPAVDPFALKEGVTELYGMLEVTSDRARAKEQDLLVAVQTLRQFQEELALFNASVATDQYRLSLLHSALKNQNVSPSTISSVRRLTALVNRAEGDSPKANGLFEPHESEEELKSWLRLTALTDLSLVQTTDSGISDGALSEGEHPLTERERKITHLKRLARKMESVLAPGSAVLSFINENLDRAMREFEDLQRSCRHLVDETSTILQPSPAGSTSNKRRSRKNKKVALDIDSERSNSVMTEHSADTLTTGTSTRRGMWLWRILKASLPIHVALLILVCAACLLEPHCCDHVNSLNFSLFPRLSYPSGPPPM